jgi:16S rRNA processing protein RimM
MSDEIAVAIGRVGRAHGLRGDVFVDLVTDEPQTRFAPGVTVLGEHEGSWVVEQARWQSGRFVVHLAGVGDRLAAEALRGTVLIARLSTSATPDDPEEFYDHQLIGLEVRLSDGSRAGFLRDVQHGAAQDLLVIDVDGQERLVPFVTALVPLVRAREGFIQLAEIPGLLDDPDADGQAKTS